MLAVVAAIGLISICCSTADAVLVTQHPLPEYKCGVRTCTSNQPTSIVANGPNQLLAGGVTSGDVYGVVTTGPTWSVAAGPIGSTAQSLTIGPDGHPWVLDALPGSGREVVAGVQDVTPGGLATIYKFPAGLGADLTAIASGDGAAWLVNGNVDRVASGEPLTEYLMAGALQPLPQAVSLVAGPEESVWATDGGIIAQITKAGKVIQHPIEDGDSFDGWGFTEPYGIAVGPDGKIWFAEQGHERIARMSADGALEEFVIPQFPGLPTPTPRFITTGPEGNMWFTDPGHDAVGRVTMNGEVTEYELPSASNNTVPEEIVTVGQELVFDESGSVLGSVDPSTAAASQAPLSAPPLPAAVSADLESEIGPLSVATRSALLDHRQVFTVSFNALEAGTATFELTVAPAKPGSAESVVASGQGDFDATETKSIQLRLTAAGEHLNRRKPWKLTLRAEFAGKWSGPWDATRTITLRAQREPLAKKHRRRGS